MRFGELLRIEFSGAHYQHPAAGNLHPFFSQYHT